MVKNLIIKRTSKNVTIDQYQAEKQKYKEEHSRSQGNITTAPRYVNIERRHKYVRPTQKLKHLDVNVAHYLNEIKILPYSYEVDQIGSFFYDELETYKFNDLTADFQEFYAEVYEVTQNLSLILHNLDLIVNKAVEFLNKNDCRKTILQILPGLFRDTQRDIFPLFLSKILPKLIVILKEKDVGILEDLFKCLAYALKYLYEDIKQNFTEFYSLYVNDFFSSHNKHIQRFTTESLSFVIRKLKGNEINPFIAIVLNPLLIDDSESKGDLLAHHIAKLLFYAIKNQQETYTSKSLTVVENIISFFLKNNVNRAVSECLLQFVREILSHSRPQEDKFEDEFQEKIKISKSQIFEQMIKIFLNWVSGLDKEITKNFAKIQVVCDMLSEMLVFRRGVFINQTLLRIIFQVVKELHSLYEGEMVEEETSAAIQKYNFGIIAKLLKYKESDLVKDQDYLQFLEQVKEHYYSPQTVNIIFQKILDELKENIPSFEYLKEDELIQANYKLQKYSYGFLLHLVLHQFSWKDIISEDTDSSSSATMLNLYLFYNVHKYSNRSNRIHLQHERFRFSSDIHQIFIDSMSQLLAPSFDPSVGDSSLNKQFFMNFIKILLLVKYLDVFEILQEEKDALRATLTLLNHRLHEKLRFLEAINSIHKDEFIPAQRLYELSDSFRSQFGFDIFRKDQEEISLKDLLLTLKGEILTKIAQFIAFDDQTNVEDVCNFVYDEFKFASSNKNHFYTIKSFSGFIELVLNNVEGSKSLMNESSAAFDSTFITNSHDQVLLSFSRFGSFVGELALNLSNPISDIRVATLQILTKIEPCHFLESKEHTESKVHGECDAFHICLEIESKAVSLETEREKIINFTLLKTYTDFKRLPLQYISPLLNFYIGSLYVRLTPIWEHIKENIASILHMNSKIVYEQIRIHYIYLNAVLNPRLEFPSKPTTTLQLSLVTEEEDLDGPKTIVDAFLDDYFVKTDYVNVEEVLKNVFGGVAKFSKPVEDNIEDFYGLFQNFLVQEYYKSFENETLRLDLETLEHQVRPFGNSSNELFTLLQKESIIANRDRDDLFKKSRYFASLKLEAILKIFMSFRNLKKMKDSEALHNILLSFLRRGHVGIQKNALECLLKFETEENLPDFEIVRKFIKPETYKDQLTQFDLSKESGSITENKRKVIIPLIIGVLYSKLFEKRGKDKSSRMEINRNKVFNFFSSLESTEIQYLMFIFFRNYGMPWEEIDKFSLETIMLHLSKLSVDRVGAFLDTLKNLIEQLGVLLFPYVNRIFKIINAAIRLSITMRRRVNDNIKNFKKYLKGNKDVKDSIEDKDVNKLLGKWKVMRGDSTADGNQAKEEITAELKRKVKESSHDGNGMIIKLFGRWKKIGAEGNDESLEEEDQILLKLLGKWKHLYQTALKRAAQLYNKFSARVFNKDTTRVFMDNLKENINKLNIESSSNVSLLLKVFVVWSKHKDYLDYFIQFNEIIPSIAKIYTQKDIKTPVLDVVNQLMFSLTGYANHNKSMEIEEDEEEGQKQQLQQPEDDTGVTASQKAESIMKSHINSLITSIKTHFENYQSASKNKVWRPNLKITKILVHLSEYVEESSLCDDVLKLFQPLINAQYINKAYSRRRARTKVPNPMTEKTIQTLNGVLKVFVRFFKHSTQQEKFYSDLINLISDLSIYAPRDSVVEMVKNLHYEKFNVSPQVIKCIEALNQYNRMMGRTLNYGNIVPVCSEINENFNSKFSFEDQQLILAQYLFFLTQEELSLRLGAVEGFRHFFEVIRENFEQNDLVNLSKDIVYVVSNLLPKFIKGMKSSDEYRVKASLDLIDMYVCCMNDLGKSGLDLTKWNPPYLDLKLLQNKTDLNQDFFDNIFNLQNHKRVKAVNILLKRLQIMDMPEEVMNTDAHISVITIKKVILPVLRFQIFSKHLQEDVLKASGSQITHAKVLVANMIDVYSMCLKHLSWPQFFNVLKVNVATLNQEPKYEKIVVRLLCANLNYLGAGLPNIVEDVEREMKNQENDIGSEGLMDKLLNYQSNQIKESEQVVELGEPKVQVDGVKSDMEIEAVPENDKKVAGIQNAEADKMQVEEEEKAKKEADQKKENVLQIVQQLRKKILAPLRRHMHDLAAQENKERKIRSYTAIAIAKLVIRFPFNIFNIEYPRLIHNICEALKSRDYDIRSNARKALNEIVLITGPYFFHFIVNEMKTVLTLGYQQHVKNYTLYYLVEGMINPKTDKEEKKIKTGSLDYCLGPMLPVFMDEILGTLQQEKEVEEIKQKIPEFRTSKAYECFQLLSSVMDVKKTFVYMVNYLKTELHTSSSNTKKCNKIEEILRNVADGLSKNPSLDLELILIICFYLIEQSLDTMMIKDTPTLDEFTLQEYSLPKSEFKKYDIQKTFLVQEGAASGKSIFKIMQQTQKKNNFIVGRVIATFSINLIMMCIKKSSIKAQSAEDQQTMTILSKFEPLTKLIVNCLKANENSIVTGSIKILNSISSWPLDSLKKNYKKIVSSVLSIVESLSLTDYDMIRVCFKLIGRVFSIPDQIKLSNNQIKGLLQFIEQFMFVSDNVGEVIDCLTVIISKKIIRPEVYDLIDKIVEAMVTNYSSTTQRSCKNAFLTFLVEYPMTEKLLNKYIQLLVKNLEYPADHGRTLVADILNRVVEILPLELLQNYYDLILYSCLVKIVNEENSEIRVDLRKVASNLMRRIPEEKVFGYVQNFLSWISDNKQGVVHSGLEGFLVLIWQDVRIEKHFRSILDIVFQNLNRIHENIVIYWHSLKDQAKRQKQQNAVQSKLLKQLMAENEETEHVNLDKFEPLYECLVNIVQAFAEKQSQVLGRYLSTDNTEFIIVLLSLVAFPKEKPVVHCLTVVQNLFEKVGEQLRNIIPDAATLMENIGYKLLNMYKMTFATSDFENILTDIVIKSYHLASPLEAEAYTILLLARIQKLLLKLMASINIYALQIQRLVRFILALETSPLVKTPLTGDILKGFTEILVRVENIRDIFGEQYDISDTVNQMTDYTQKRSDNNEFIRVYSENKVKLQELKLERKRKAKEDVLINPEEVMKEKLRRKEKRKKSKKKYTFNSPLARIKKYE